MSVSCRHHISFFHSTVAICIHRQPMNNTVDVVQSPHQYVCQHQLWPVCMFSAPLSSHSAYGRKGFETKQLIYMYHVIWLLVWNSNRHVALLPNRGYSVSSFVSYVTWSWTAQSWSQDKQSVSIINESIVQLVVHVYVSLCVMTYKATKSTQWLLAICH